MHGMQARRGWCTPANALIDAAATGIVVATVDLKLLPPLLAPGFERRLSGRGVIIVYAGLAIGLAVGGLWAAATLRARTAASLKNRLKKLPRETMTTKQSLAAPQPAIGCRGR